MQAPDWRKTSFREGILTEPILDDGRLVLWLRRECKDGYQYWERISSQVRGEITAQQGTCGTPATSVRARQPLHGFLGKLWQRLQKAEGNWLLPGGESAEQCGDRRSDLLLAWATTEIAPLNQARIRARWPESQHIEQLANNLFLVWGVAAPETREAAPPPQPSASPREQGERLLALARQSGDRTKQMLALTDLGLVHLHEADAGRAVALLQEAATLAGEAGDRARASDVRVNLGMAVLTAGQGQQALQILQPELEFARTSGNRYLEKNVLDHIGLAYSSLGAVAQSIPFFEQALLRAREIGDRKHEGELLWYLSIQQAELGRREEALTYGQAAVDLLTRTGRPQASVFAQHLQSYRLGGAPPVFPGAGQPAVSPSTSAQGSGSFVAGIGVGHPASSPGPPQAGNAGLLRMALSAAQSMARFVGSGFRTASPQMQQRRLQTCAACEHHTGMRCRVCGCFTDLKTRLAYEECPLGKWPA